MNTVAIALFCIVWFAASYYWYGGFIERKLGQPDDSVPTPAHVHPDGIDFVPSRKRLVWGNHFASIAGAGPIIGPILAMAMFGWGPTLVWVCVGSVFMGAVHDYLCLMYSVRNNGDEIFKLAESALGPVSRVLFALLLYCMLLLLITVFMVSVAQAFVTVPALVIPTFGLIFIAMLMGWALHKMHLPEVPVYIVSVALAYSLIWVGVAFPLSLPGEWGHATVMAVWFVVISGYCLLASVAPIWVILQPRDFISSVKLGVGILLGFLGIVVVQPVMSAPFSGSMDPSTKPLWPMLFIIVACGAISGFHSLVSTGTTSKQLDRQSDAKPVAFGGMLMEGMLSMLVILVVGAGLSWGYAPDGLVGSPSLQYFGDALKDNWIVAFGNGFGRIVGEVGIPGLTVSIAGLLGAVMVKSFVLTTLDSGTRLARFLVEETLGSRIALFRNNIAAALFLLVPSYFLAVTNSYATVWQMFGTANQITAGIALVTVGVLLAAEGRATRYVMIPAVFMLITTAAALVWELFAPGTGFFVRANPQWSLGLISLVLLGLAVVGVISAVGCLRRRLATKRAA